MDANRLAPWRKVLLAVVLLLVLGLFTYHSVQAQTENPPLPSSPFPSAELSTNIQTLAAGFAHTCTLTTAGGVKCWGDNSYGQLGDGTFFRRPAPVGVTGLISGVQAVTAGDLHTCGLTEAGGVQCWGRNQHGQLGDGTTDDSPAPAKVTGVAGDVQAVAAGNAYTCALTTGGGVKCWGANTFGQLGDGTTTDRLTPVDVSGLTSGVQMVAAGSNHTCALTTAGGVQCWGYNGSGQLGNGTTTDSLTPVDVSGLTAGVQMIAAGSYHTCALTTTGGVQCWGTNLYGQLGDGTATYRPTPVDVSGLSSGVQRITAGEAHTCALANGGVKCWGWNSSGQLGDGTGTDRLTPVDVSGLTAGVQAIAAGYRHTCALASGGGVQCWGANGAGQLGDGTGARRPTPVDVSDLTSGVQMVAAGWEHTCALTTAGGVQCWGHNDTGQLGDGLSANRYTPAAVNGLSSGVQMVVAGYFHACALTTAGGVKCWGDNDYGQLGDGTTASRQSPVDVSGLTSGVQGIAAGGFYTCALTSGGGVKCWGRNDSGQLGDGATSGSLTPVDVSDLTSGVSMVAAGHAHTCALTTANVRCWGDNNSGQLGDGTTNGSLTPVSVGGLTGGVQMVTAGYAHTCALASGGVKCWGENEYGQLGDGKNADHLTPVDVSGLTSGVQAVAAGSSHTCALTTAGGAECWGRNSYGQVGDGTTTSRSKPVDVSSLSGGVQMVAAGYTHTCAVITAGGVQCWGYNSYGQVGANPGWTPVAVVNSPTTPDQAAQITSTPGTTATVGQPYTYTVTATGVPTPTFHLVAAPIDMTIDPASGLIRWTPPAPGNYSVTVKAKNGVEPAAQQSFIIRVANKEEGADLYLPLINK